MRDDINPLYDYAERLSGPIPDYLRRLERQTFLRTLAPQMMCSPLQGRLLALLSKLQRPRRILELGTFTGYSALCLAEGLSADGRLVTIEGNAEHAHMARQSFAASPYEQQIELLEGDVFERFETVDQQPFDLVFLDAKKRDYRRYFDLFFPLLSPGGLWISDNVSWDGRVVDPADASAQATGLHDYNLFLAEHPLLEVVMLPMRDGLSVARRLK